VLTYICRPFLVKRNSFLTRVGGAELAVGSLFGIGLTTGKANPKVMMGIVLSRIITLPCAAAISAADYWVMMKL